MRRRWAEPLPEDHVLGVGGASLTLAGLQLPTPARAASTSAPDAASRRCARAATSTDVVATDISERALRLHAAERAAQRRRRRSRRGAGSLFEPVAGEQFDRIVSNPPFVITPRVAGVPAYEYRDGGMRRRRSRRRVRLAASARTSRPAAWHSCSATGRRRDGTTGLDRVRAWVDGIAGPAGRMGRSNARVARPAVVRGALDPRRRHAAGHPGVRARWSTRGSTTSPLAE